MQETHGQYSRIGMHGMGCVVKISLPWSYCKERQSFAIPFIANIKKELIVFIIVYFILHHPPYFVLHLLFLEAATENYPLK